MTKPGRKKEEATVGGDCQQQQDAGQKHLSSTWDDVCVCVWASVCVRPTGLTHMRIVWVWHDMRALCKMEKWNTQHKMKSKDDGELRLTMLARICRIYAYRSAHACTAATRQHTHTHSHTRTHTLHSVLRDIFYLHTLTHTCTHTQAWRVAIFMATDRRVPAS